jgi:hypothetical protein
MDGQAGRHGKAAVRIFGTFRCEHANLENMMAICDTLLTQLAPAVD